MIRIYTNDSEGISAVAVSFELPTNQANLQVQQQTQRTQITQMNADDKPPVLLRNLRHLRLRRCLFWLAAKLGPWCVGASRRRSYSGHWDNP
jgi:hypothetical protein